MNKKIKFIDYKIIYFFVLILCCFLSFAAVVEEIDKKLDKLKPPQTELVSKKEDSTQPFMKIIQYKYNSLSNKETITSFYNSMFINEGFTELDAYSARKESKSFGEKYVYFFTKPNVLIVLNILRQPENDFCVYYITINTLDTKAIKDFNYINE